MGSGDFMTNSTASRKDYTLEKLNNLSSGLKKHVEITDFGDLTIYATGSYARKEASEHSDIDLFFLLKPNPLSKEEPNIASMRMFTKVIEVVDRMGFPSFSNDGEFLKIIRADDITNKLGGREDDYHNHFTARMLLLLESVPLVGRNEYDEILTAIIQSYFRDYPDHPSDFSPTFLTNDIMRFWKTLCLNYEHKRNQPAENQAKVTSQKIKNLKLKFSRMLTCFGSIGYLVAHDRPITPEIVMEMTKLSPLERLIEMKHFNQSLTKSIEQASDQYSWFIELTGMSKEELETYFMDKPNRIEAFRKADEFGQSIFDVVHDTATKNGYLRYLLV